jgi:hypothetical protein
VFDKVERKVPGSIGPGWLTTAQKPYLQLGVVAFTGVLFAK